jgi:molybdopterin/thiamine biosynthesis adenylyltransferase
MSAAIPTEAELLESQKQRYDRQIRVWGAGNIYMLKHSN